MGAIRAIKQLPASCRGRRSQTSRVAADVASTERSPTSEEPLLPILRGDKCGIERLFLKPTA